MSQLERVVEGVRDKRKSGNVSVGATVWLNVDLSKEDKVELAAYIEDGEFDLASLAAIVDEGFRLTLGYSTRANAFVASLFDNDKESATFNHALSGMGSTAQNAMHAILYKHAVKLSGDWTNALNAASAEEYA